MSRLPEPRRVIAAHHPDGKPHIIDEVMPTTDAGSGFRVAQLFAQMEFEISNPTSVAEQGKAGTPHSKVAGGVAARFVDIQPNTDTFMHFTNTIDYLCITHGELECVNADGSKFTIKAGDTVVQVANIHQWNNKKDEWARFLCICLPCQPVEVSGKGLKEAPFDATEMVY